MTCAFRESDSVCSGKPYGAWCAVLPEGTVRTGHCGDCYEGRPQARVRAIYQVGGEKSVENLPEMIREFDEALWGSLVEKVTVYSKDRIVFTMTSGMEIEA